MSEGSASESRSEPYEAAMELIRQLDELFRMPVGKVLTRGLDVRRRDEEDPPGS